MNLDKLIIKLNKDFGEGAVMKGADATWFQVEKIPTGSFALDIELRGGIPRSRITEIYGHLSSGKSSLTMMIAKKAQKLGGKIGYVDMEGCYDSKYAAIIGIDPENIIISQPDYGEKAIDILDSMVRSGEFSLVVLDSIAATTPMVEIEESMVKQQMGIQARLINKAVRKLQSALNTKIEGKQNKTAVILINQIRQKLGILYGNPETTPGGMGVGFGASLRLNLRRGDWIMIGKGEKEQTIGQEVKFRVEKSKVSPAHVNNQFRYYFKDVPELGIKAGTVDTLDEIVRYGSIYGAIEQGGGWFQLNGEKFHGIDGVKSYLQANKEARQKVKQFILDVSCKGYAVEKVKEG